MATVKALLIPVGESPRPITIDGLKGLQTAVGGCVECAGWIFDDQPTVYLNDEGKYSCLPNRAVYAAAEDAGKHTWDGGTVAEGDVLDVIFGDFVAVGFDPETGEDRDITDEEIERVMRRFGKRSDIWSGFREVMRIRAEAD